MDARLEVSPSHQHSTSEYDSLFDTIISCGASTISYVFDNEVLANLLRI